MIPGGLNGNKSWSSFQLGGDHDRRGGALTGGRGDGNQMKLGDQINLANQIGIVNQLNFVNQMN